MFKTGDIVVCIDDSDDTNSFEPYKNLKKYSTYTVEKCGNYYNCISVLLNDIEGSFRETRFLSLNEYRKLKLEKICLSQVIK